mgnify:CR=1 FL=1
MTTREILGQFRKRSALVAGDICLDRWCQYDPAVAEPSRETGIPRIGAVSTVVTPGAGGTVANNLAALGVGRVAVLGATGRDGFGEELRWALAERGIEHTLLVTDPAIQTFTYTKLLNLATGDEDLPRLDFINTKPLDAPTERRLIDGLAAAAPAFDVILVSDQAETSQGGVVTAAMRDAIAALAIAHPDKIIWVDSRERLELFRGAYLKANEDEIRSACSRLFGRPDYPALRRHARAPGLLMTQGPAGVLVFDDLGERFIATRRVEHPVDICGAGDSFSAAAAMALAVTGSLDEAARLGNLVASVTIMKRGTGTASAEEVLAAESEL